MPFASQCAVKANLICRKSDINQNISKLIYWRKHTHSHNHVKENWLIDGDVMHFVTTYRILFATVSHTQQPNEWKSSTKRTQTPCSQYRPIHLVNSTENERMGTQLWHVRLKPIKQGLCGYDYLQIRARPFHSNKTGQEIRKQQQQQKARKTFYFQAQN